MKLNKRVYATIDLDAVIANLESMKNNLKEGTKIVAVVKTDAYGHGAKEIAKTVEDIPYIWGFAVATLEEGEILRRNGIKKPILILGVTFPEECQQIIERDIRPTVCNFEMAEKISKEAQKIGKICRIHIKIDSGMGRIGFLVNEENAETICQISKLPNIEIEGMFTHFARADELSKEPAYDQISLFKKMVKMVEDKGVSIKLKHCSNSAGIVEIPEANMDMVRAGITLYGLWPSEDVKKDIIDLKPVMSLHSTITFIKEVEKGTAISYGGTYVADSKRRIATVPVGYGDGYSRGLSNKGYVLIHGQKAPICGRVCMDQMMVDVTDIKDVKVFDDVTLLGKDGEEEITLEQLGEISGRFNYEFACLITSRVARYYIKDGKVLYTRDAYKISID
ncbi:alanine racemase [Lachnobacterium bovis]|uniref:Alanine racemase n=1 Tax=Lachnobacterium bovis TaxID=140626 RepID=A0A1H9PSS5_9FIRM|nr:alanine racemase [Lachnobacterium bovis]SER51178.1 alanine racemase [Lachnobacterium bovis]